MFQTDSSNNSHHIETLLKSDRPIIMAILNLTPDSFSDGLPGATIDDFINKAEKLINDGADILDIGGESTRPQAEFVELEEEKKRVLPFLEKFRKRFPKFPISLDTKKYDLAKEAMDYDVQILNDVNFLTDVRFLDLAKYYNCFYILMHSRGNSLTMTKLVDYPKGVVKGIQEEIDQRLEKIIQCKFPNEKLILDLGFGFAKTPEQCVELFENLSCWKNLGYPLLLGISRKRFLQLYTGENEPQDRDQISAEMALKAFKQGFQIIRTHNVLLTKKILNSCEYSPS